MPSQRSKSGSGCSSARAAADKCMSASPAIGVRSIAPGSVVAFADWNRGVAPEPSINVRDGGHANTLHDNLNRGPSFRRRK
jgi:hypothetical protein